MNGWPLLVQSKYPEGNHTALPCSKLYDLGLPQCGQRRVHSFIRLYSPLDGATWPIYYDQDARVKFDIIRVFLLKSWVVSPSTVIRQNKNTFLAFQPLETFENAKARQDGVWAVTCQFDNLRRRSAPWPRVIATGQVKCGFERQLFVCVVTWVNTGNNMGWSGHWVTVSLSPHLVSGETGRRCWVPAKHLRNSSFMPVIW